VYYLDGGFRAWLEAGGPTDTTAPNFDAAPYGSGEQLGSYRVDAEWVRDHLDDESVALLDVRTSGEFADGFIPGAINIDWTTNVSNGAFLDETALRTLFAPLGGAGDTVVVYCRSGSRASVSWAALHWLGFDALLYDGSWSEWGSLDPAEYPRSLPVGQ
jgi:thiosulfate/3-mercaptopyruvate sulfurtransferase